MQERSCKGKNDARSETVFSDTTSTSSIDQDRHKDNQRTEGLPQSRLGKAYADIIQHTITGKSPTLAETGFFNLSSLFTKVVDNSNARNSTTEKSISPMLY